jgi:hypothetical protein
MTDVSRWLPTLQQAQGLELPDGQPQEVRKFAALIVIAGAVRRDSWDDVVDEREASETPTQSPASEPSDYQERTHRWVVGPVPGRAGRYRVRYTNDRPIGICDLFAPTLPIVYSFEGALERMAQLGVEPPEELRCEDLRPRDIGGSAYRGGGKLQEPDFHGFSFGDAIEKGARAVDQIGVRGTVFLLRVRAYAWPFLWLRYRHDAPFHELIVAPSRTGGLQLAAAHEPD